MSLAVFVMFAALIGTVLLIEVKSLVLSSPGEILNHVFASGGFTLAASGVLLLLTRTRPSALTLMTVGAMITIALEAAQALSPTRDAEVHDLLAGLSGVLVTAIVLETAFRLWPHRTTLRLHVITASVGSFVLVILLMFNWSPGTVRTARPDGRSCPLTEITADGGRLTVGAFEASNGCVTTESGGLGLVGPWKQNDLYDRAVLVTSDLPDLRQDIQDFGRLHVQVQITTDELQTKRRSVLLLLRTASGHHVMNLRTQRHRLDVSGPNLTDPLLASVAAQTLEPKTTHLVDVVLTATELELMVDGRPVSRTTMDPEWHNYLEGQKLQLLIGNNAHRSAPFRGVIDWIEINP